jgi:dUTP pyrophosphatase
MDGTLELAMPGTPFQLQVIDERVKVGENQLTCGSEMSAGLDVSVWPEEPVEFGPKSEAKLLPTGIKLWINSPRLVGLMYARSGTGHRGLVLGNGTGVIDADYQGEWKVSLWNRSDEHKIINPGDRVAQVVFMPFLQNISMTQVAAFKETDRGEGGFGSTGV